MQQRKQKLELFLARPGLDWTIVVYNIRLKSLYIVLHDFTLCKFTTQYMKTRECVFTFFFLLQQRHFNYP